MNAKAEVPSQVIYPVGDVLKHYAERGVDRLTLSVDENGLYAVQWWLFGCTLDCDGYDDVWNALADSLDKYLALQYFPKPSTATALGGRVVGLAREQAERLYRQLEMTWGAAMHARAAQNLPIRTPDPRAQLGLVLALIDIHSPSRPPWEVWHLPTT